MPNNETKKLSKKLSKKKLSKKLSKKISKKINKKISKKSKKKYKGGTLTSDTLKNVYDNIINTPKSQFINESLELDGAIFTDYTELAKGGEGEVHLHNDGKSVLKVFLRKSTVKKVDDYVILFTLLNELQIAPKLINVVWDEITNKFGIVMPRYQADLEQYLLNIKLELDHKIVNNINIKLTNIINKLIQYKILLTDLKADNILVNYNTRTNEIIELGIGDISGNTVCYSSNDIVYSKLFKIDICKSAIPKEEQFSGWQLIMYEFLLYFYYHLFYIYVLFNTKQTNTSILFNDTNLIYNKLLQYTEEELNKILNAMSKVDDVSYYFNPSQLIHLSNFIINLFKVLRNYIKPLKNYNSDAFSSLESTEMIYTSAINKLILYFMQICVTENNIITDLLIENANKINKTDAFLYENTGSYDSNSPFTFDDEDQPNVDLIWDDNSDSKADYGVDFWKEINNGIKTIEDTVLNEELEAN